MKKKSLIAEANERVSIVLACRLAGVDTEDGRTVGSTKTYCPFGRFYHSDGGKEPAFRVYTDSNSAYCFSCKKYFTPTTLLSDAWDIPKKQAAQELLEKIDYRPLSAAELWAGVQEKELAPDTSMLGMALKTYCMRIDSKWHTSQFEPGVSGYLDKCLSLLDRVTTEDEADKWLETCKEVMTRVLRQRVTQ
jgi:hypothetical protein